MMNEYVTQKHKRLGAKALALLMAAVMTFTNFTTVAFATDDNGGAVHDYGKSGDDPTTTNVDESNIVASGDVMKSAQYQASTKYELTANSTAISIYKYQKSASPGKFYNMDVARFSSDDATPTFEIKLKDGTKIDNVEVYPKWYYPQDALEVSGDKTTLRFTMSENLRYCIVNINGTVSDKVGKPQLAIINDAMETNKPDLNAGNVLNFKEFSESYLTANPINDMLGAECRPAGTVTDTSKNTTEEFTWNYGAGVYQSYTNKDVQFPNKRQRYEKDVTDAFQAALVEVKNSAELDTIYFPAGTYIWSGLSIKNWNGNGVDGKLNIYVDEASLLVNRLQECQEAIEPAIGIWDSSNITISGRGIFDGQGSYTHSLDPKHANQTSHQGGSMVVHSQNITFNDTYVRDAKQWNWECHTVENITYNNIKGLTPYENPWVDGLDLTSGKNVTVNGAFTMGNDDTFASGHYNPSDEFPRRFFEELEKATGGNKTTMEARLPNVAAAAAIYNKDRLIWDNDDSENYSINNTLGWSTFANSIRLGHNTRFKGIPGQFTSYKMKSYTFNNFNSVLVAGDNSGTASAIRAQNGTNDCYPEYESLIFRNSSFSGNNSQNIAIPVGTNEQNFNPATVIVENCWFDNATKDFDFRSIQDLTIKDLYVGGNLLTYTSQAPIIFGDNIGNMTFTANGNNVIKNTVPRFIAPVENNIQAYTLNPLSFTVEATDSDEGDEVTLSVDQSTLPTGATFNTTTREFFWTPTSQDVNKTYKVVFTAKDKGAVAEEYVPYTPATKTVQITVSSSENNAQTYYVSEDARMQTWKTEKTLNFGTANSLITRLITGKGMLGEKFTDTSTTNATDGKMSMMKFDLTEIKKQAGKFDKAELVLTYLGCRTTTANQTGSVRVAAVDNSTWTEDTIIWNNRPTFSTDATDSVKESVAFDTGTIVTLTSDKVDQKIDGRKVTIDITDFVNNALTANKDYLSLAISESKGLELYFVSREGAINNTNADETMAPLIALNLPTDLAVEGPTEMTIQEGYQATASENFVLKGKTPITVEITNDTSNGKISWNKDNHQLDIAEGLTQGNYSVTLTVKNQDGKTVTCHFALTVIVATNKPVISIAVSGQNGESSITTPSGILLMVASILPKDATNKSVTWSVENGTGSATIDANGVLTALSNGTVTVKAISVSTPLVSGTGSIEISGQAESSNVPVTSIAVSGGNGASSITTPSGILLMVASVLPEDATDKSVIWSVENETGSAAINTNGILTAVSNGTVTVKATSVSTPSVSETCSIEISGQTETSNVAVTSVAVSGQNGVTSITTKSGTLQMVANVLPADATEKSVIWSVENGTGSATINTNGILTAVTSGIVTVKATSVSNPSVLGTCTIAISGQNSGSGNSGSSSGSSNQTVVTPVTPVAETNPVDPVKKVEQAIQQLPAAVKKEIEKKSQEYSPYTLLTTKGLSVEQLAKLTNNKFKKEELEIMLNKPEMLKTLGIDTTKLSASIILKPIENASFTDVKASHWANEAIKKAAELGLVAGMPDGSFAPSEFLKIAHAFTFLDRILLLNNVSESNLPRSVVEKYITDKESWAFSNMASVGSKLNEETLKTITSLEDQPLSRELLAQVLYELTNGKLKATKIVPVFIDTENSSYKEAINYCVSVGLLNGTSAVTISPQKALTRAELMSVLIRMDNLLEE